MPGRRSDGDTTASQVVRWLKAHGTASVRAGMARYAIPADHAVGVTMVELKAYSRTLGKDHALALALWDTGIYEARMLAAFVDEPARVTAGQMERWCRDFDNWATCDHACFHLFDRTPHAHAKVKAWAVRKPEFQKRAAFALLAAMALHDKAGPDAPYRGALALIDGAAGDERNFVKKGVLWALRGVGGRSPALHREAMALARTMADSDEPSRRWIGREALREMGKRVPRTRRGTTSGG
jgi:3-methyladenine DNA glycosylase AlkD